MDRTDTHAERLLTQARALTPESTDDAVNDIIRQTAKGRVLPSNSQSARDARPKQLDSGRDRESHKTEAWCRFLG